MSLSQALNQFAQNLGRYRPIPLLSEIEIAGLNKPVWMFRFSAITKTDGIYC